MSRIRKRGGGRGFINITVGRGNGQNFRENDQFVDDDCFENVTICTLNHLFSYWLLPWIKVKGISTLILGRRIRGMMLEGALQVVQVDRALAKRGGGKT